MLLSFEFWLLTSDISTFANMHAFRAFLLVVVMMVVASEGIFLKKHPLEKKLEVKKGFLADAKLAALKFKAGVALKKAAVLGTLKAVKKAKLGLLDGLKDAKLKVLKTIAGVKLAKLAALKAGKLAFLKTLAAVKLAPYVAKKFAEGDVLAKFGGLLKKGGDPKDKLGKLSLDGLLGIFGGGVPFGDGGDNPLVGIIGDAFLGGLGGGAGGGLPFDLSSILSNIGGLASLLPLLAPAEQPAVNVDNYQVNNSPAPIVTYEAPPVVYERAPVSYEPAPVVTSYGTPISAGSSSSSYSQPATTYGVPEYN